jgi:hypothetical protein
VSLSHSCVDLSFAGCAKSAETRDRTGDLQIFSLTLSQLSYRGPVERAGRVVWQGASLIEHKAALLAAPAPVAGTFARGRGALPLAALRLEGKKVTTVGFEPTHPKIMELESTALDHSARLSWLHSHQAWPPRSARARLGEASRNEGATVRECSATLQARRPCSAVRLEQSSPKTRHLWDSNPRGETPSA